MWIGAGRSGSSADLSTEFGYVDAVDEASLLGLARELSRSQRRRRPDAATGRRRPGGGASPPAPPRPAGESASARSGWPGSAGLLRLADETARGLSGEVRQVVAVYGESRQRVWIAGSDGSWNSDERIRKMLAVSVMAQRGALLQVGRETLAVQGSLEDFRAERSPRLAAAAAQKALIMLDSVPAPAGRMPVVLANGFGGRAVPRGLRAWAGGRLHPQEDQRVGGQERAARGRRARLRLRRRRRRGHVGQRAVRRRGDAMPAHPGHRGGHPHRLPHRPAAGRAPGAAAHRQRPAAGLSPSALPAHDQHLLRPRDAHGRSRSSPTPPGLCTPSRFPAERSTRPPASSSSGWPRATSSRAAGSRRRCGAPRSSAAALEVLLNIDAIADDLDIKPGTCGKEGQHVSVGSGQPTLRIRELTVGGTNLG